MIRHKLEFEMLEWITRVDTGDTIPFDSYPVVSDL